MNTQTFNSILIIGASGQTGQLYTQTISHNIQNIRIEVLIREEKIKKFLTVFPGNVLISSNLKLSLNNQPEAIILATPNPTQKILKEICPNIKTPTTLILPQNGIEVAGVAREIFQGKNVELVRASLFTTISLDSKGQAVYDQKKLRIAISPISPISPSDSEKDHGKTKTLFEQSGFQVKLFADYKSMEWTKLITNLLGSSAAITGLAPFETFTDEKLFTLETKALKDRLEILEAAGIHFAGIPWHKIYWLSIAKYLPANFLKANRSKIAQLIAQGRNNEPPAAARKIAGRKPTELRYYHQPFIDLGLLHGLRSVLDEALMEIISEHENAKIDLSALSIEEKKRLLFDTYDKFLQKPFIPRNPFETSVVEKITNFFCKTLTVSGQEDIELVRQSLASGQSAILLANHTSHADHPLLVKALKQSGFQDLASRLIFISGRKLEREFLGRIFSDAYPRILVSTPSSDVQTEEENRKSQLINLKGFSEITRILNQGNLLVIYPEGTRSRDNKLLKAIPSVARYFENPNIACLVPVAIQGSDNLLPVGSKIPRFASAKVTFGHSISPDKLFEDVSKYLPQGMKNSDKRDKNVRAKINELAIDLVMKQIAILLPQEQRGFYA